MSESRKLPGEGAQVGAANGRWLARIPFFLAPIILVLTLVGAGVALHAQTVEGRTSQLEEAARHARGLLVTAQREAMAYKRERIAERVEAEKRLMVEVRAVLSDVHALLQEELLALHATINPLESRRLDALQAFGWLDNLPDELVEEVPDRVQMLLSSTSPRLEEALPQGMSLAVLDENGEALLQIGVLPAASKKEESLRADATREFLFTLPEGNHLWTLRAGGVALHPPQPLSEAEMATRMGEWLRMAGEDGQRVRGLLLNGDSEVVAVFPDSAPGAQDLPLPAKPDCWRLLNKTSGRQATLLAMQKADGGLPWGIGMQVLVEDPPVNMRMWTRLTSDRRWLAFVGVALLATVGSLLLGLRRNMPPLPVGEPVRKQEADAPSATRRLVKKHPERRTVPEDATVLLADIEDGADGEPVVRVREGGVRMRPGSVMRLRRRFGVEADGLDSRVLQGARSPMLRALVQRVRPGSAQASRVAHTEAPRHDPLVARGDDMDVLAETLYAEE